jgi:hypothetical protein
VHLEGDSKNLVDAVNGDVANWSLMGHIVEDIKIELRNFTQWKMSFIKKGTKWHICLLSLMLKMEWILYGVNLHIVFARPFC